jgi:hypothetical protein
MPLDGVAKMVNPTEQQRDALEQIRNVTLQASLSPRACVKKIPTLSPPPLPSEMPTNRHIFALGCLSRLAQTSKKAANIGLIRSLAVIHRMTLLNSRAGKSPQINDKAASGAGHGNH